MEKAVRILKNHLDPRPVRQHGGALESVDIYERFPVLKTDFTAKGNSGNCALQQVDDLLVIVK